MIHLIARLVPRPEERLAAKRIEAWPAQSMPVAHRETQMLRHGLAEDLALGVIEAESQRIAAVRSVIFDRVRERIESHGR